MKKASLFSLFLLLAFSLSAQVEYLYDFNSLTEGTQNLNGQDGWMTHYQTATSLALIGLSLVPQKARVILTKLVSALGLSMA